MPFLRNSGIPYASDRCFRTYRAPESRRAVVACVLTFSSALVSPKRLRQRVLRERKGIPLSLRSLRGVLYGGDDGTDRTLEGGA